MTIVAAGYGHETNTFAAGSTGLEAFRGLEAAFADGAAIVRSSQDTRTVVGGCLAAAERLGVTCRPVFRAFATPSAMVTAAAEAALLAELLSRVAAEPVRDALVLPLHGAMASESHADAEGHLLRAVRERFGPALPLVVTLDLHANVSRDMAALADLTIGFDLYPHTDMGERGEEAMALAVDLARGRIRPVTAYCALPLLTMPPRQCTLIEPMRTVLAALHSVEARPGVLTGTVAMGFPFADVPCAGVSVLVATDGDPDAAPAHCAELSELIWSLRERFLPELTPVDEVIAYAYAAERGRPVLLADGSDNPGGGAPADGTVILRRLLAAGAVEAVVAAIYDPETADQAHAAGCGSEIDVRLGGKTDDRHGEPVTARAYVRLLSDGRFRHHSAMAYGAQGNMGRCAVLQLGGVTVVVCSHRHQVWDPEFLRSVGVEPARQRLIALKSAVHFRDAFEPLADRVFDADTPGVHRPDFAAYTWRHLRRPIYPLDLGTTFDPGLAVEVV